MIDPETGEEIYLRSGASNEGDDYGYGLSAAEAARIADRIDADPNPVRAKGWGDSWDMEVDAANLKEGQTRSNEGSRWQGLDRGGD